MWIIKKAAKRLVNLELKVLIGKYQDWNAEC